MVPLRLAWLSILAVPFVLLGCTDRGAADSGRSSEPAQVVAEASRRFLAAMPDAVGQVREARYAGDRIIVLDRYSPFLRLFTLDGEPLWVGGHEGGGPRELEGPQTVAVAVDSTVVVAQPGRISAWHLQGDSLAFAASYPLAPRYYPLGLEEGCEDGWLFYARDHSQFDDSTWVVMAGPEVAYLHRLRIAGDSVELEPLLREPRDPNALAILGHDAALIARTGRQIVLLHRAGAWSPGRILELDCDGRIVRSHSERPLITGDSLPVRYPRTRALQWTDGIVALGNGWLLPQQRYFSPRFHEVEQTLWKTEVLHFEEHGYMGSAVLDGQWSFDDYAPEHGILMSTDLPIPHFIRVPASALLPEKKRP